MRSEIRYIEPIRFANVVALVYALVGLVFVVLALPFVFMSMAWGESSGAFSIGITLILVVLYPVFGLFFGWLTGLLGAAIYNLVARWVGGIYLELRTEMNVPDDR